MNYTLAVFRSRFATLSFANLLKENNIPVAIINTPSHFGNACGISVKFLSDYLSKVQLILSRRGGLNNLVGFYPYTQASKFWAVKQKSILLLFFHKIALWSGFWLFSSRFLLFFFWHLVSIVAMAIFFQFDSAKRFLLHVKSLMLKKRLFTLS